MDQSSTFNHFTAANKGRTGGGGGSARSETYFCAGTSRYFSDVFFFPFYFPFPSNTKLHSLMLHLCSLYSLTLLILTWTSAFPLWQRLKRFTLCQVPACASLFSLCSCCSRFSQAGLWFSSMESGTFCMVSICRLLDKTRNLKEGAGRLASGLADAQRSTQAVHASRCWQWRIVMGLLCASYHTLIFSPYLTRIVSNSNISIQEGRPMWGVTGGRRCWQGWGLILLLYHVGIQAPSFHRK